MSLALNIDGLYALRSLFDKNVNYLILFGLFKATLALFLYGLRIPDIILLNVFTKLLNNCSGK